MLAFVLVNLAGAGYSQTPDAFNPNAELGSVSVVAVQADGKILVGGLFDKLGGQTRKSIGRLNPDGTLDNTFAGGAIGGPLQQAVSTLGVQSDGKILVGGQFTNLAGQVRNNIGRFNADGTLDTSFNTSVGGSVGLLFVQPDDRILVVGPFTMLGGEARTNIGRLNANGTLDTSFNPGTEVISAFGMAIQTNGQILVSGNFTNLAGQARPSIGRLNANGTLDTSFNAGTNGYILAVQADGRILVTGSFTNLSGQVRQFIRRLNENGSVDPTFNVDTDFNVVAAAVQADGRILAVGAFTNLAGQLHKCIGRLEADGSLDTNFSLTISSLPNPIALAFVNTVALQADGKIVMGGGFITVGGQSRTNIARLNNTGPATQSLAFDGSTVTWLRGGTSPELWRTTFDYSVNGTDWTNLGDGVRIPGGWQLAGISAPANSAIRARGFVIGGRVTSAFVESITRPIISRNDRSFGFTSNRFGFNVGGNPGQVMVVEGSTNLVNWIALTTNTVGNGPLYFSDPSSENLPRRSYRVRLQ